MKRVEQQVSVRVERQSFLGEVAELAIQKGVPADKIVIAFAHGIAELVVLSAKDPQEVFDCLKTLHQESLNHAINDPLNSYRRWL